MDGPREKSTFLRDINEADQTDIIPK